MKLTIHNLLRASFIISLIFFMIFEIICYLTTNINLRSSNQKNYGETYIYIYIYTCLILKCINLNISNEINGINKLINIHNINFKT